SKGNRQKVGLVSALSVTAELLILDEPTAALGVKEAAVVLRYIAQARARGLGVVFITHNVHHAYPIADRFTILNRGRSYGTFARKDVSREEVVQMMAGGEALEELGNELEEFARRDAEADSARRQEAAHTEEAMARGFKREGIEAERGSPAPN
ncbi:MAG: hypothetical protein KC432_11050, partial [Thermomicrobiales bacterium]|nr:hypothetical protein [Thermomicrobiales bacterium]